MEEVGPHGSNPTAINGTSGKKKKMMKKIVCFVHILLSYVFHVSLFVIL